MRRRCKSKSKSKATATNCNLKIDAGDDHLSSIGAFGVGSASQFVSVKHLAINNMSAADEQLALLPAGARIAYNGLDTEASRYVINIGACRLHCFLPHIALSLNFCSVDIYILRTSIKSYENETVLLPSMQLQKFS